MCIYIYIYIHIYIVCGEALDDPQTPGLQASEERGGGAETQDDRGGDREGGDGEIHRYGHICVERDRESEIERERECA